MKAVFFLKDHAGTSVTVRVPKWEKTAWKFRGENARRFSIVGNPLFFVGRDSQLQCIIHIFGKAGVPCAHTCFFFNGEKFYYVVWKIMVGIITMSNLRPTWKRSKGRPATPIIHYSWFVIAPYLQIAIKIGSGDRHLLSLLCSWNHHKNTPAD